MLYSLKAWTKAMLDKFLYDEKGDVNIVSMVVLIGVAVVLAVVFKDQISNLITTLLETINNNATDAINNVP